MAEESRPPPQSSDNLPRRVPGVNWRHGGQVRSADSPAARSAAISAAQSPQSAGRLPKRAPGTSAIQAAPRVSRLPPLPEPVTDLDDSPTMPLPAASPPLAAPRSAPRRPATQSPVPAAPLIPVTTASRAPAAAPQPVTQAPDRTAARRKPAPARARRWWLAGLLLAVLAGVPVLLVALHQPSRQAAGAAPANAGSRRIADQAAVRDHAAAWVASQVGHNILVACDELTCADLVQHGFPAASLNVLQSTAPDLYGSQLVVATAGIRSQFGSQLTNEFAPQVIASFGTGANRIDIRVIAADGAAAFRQAQRADLRASQAAATQLLSKAAVVVSPGARLTLQSGRVDGRLLTVLAFLASQQSIDIVGFRGADPGADPGVPLRIADLSVADPAASGGATGSYLQQLVNLLHSPTPAYAPLRVADVRLETGQRVLQVTFAAPSPLDLLG
jgi:hypothetical protein